MLASTAESDPPVQAKKSPSRDKACSAVHRTARPWAPLRYSIFPVYRPGTQQPSVSDTLQTLVVLFILAPQATCLYFVKWKVICAPIWRPCHGRKGNTLYQPGIMNLMNGCYTHVGHTARHWCACDIGRHDGTPSTEVFLLLEAHQHQA